MTKQKQENEKPEQLKCGLIMPISAIDGCTEQHWADVRTIITETLESVRFNVVLVSEADDVGIIQKRIVQNLYENPLVICDVSCKNPNVMFELGMRLAFDKPTIIIKDDKTTYSFDTAPIEHLEYPRDLRFTKIVEFKQTLADKAVATYEESIKNKDYTAFLKHFGQFKVPKLDTVIVSKEEYILEELKSIRRELNRELFERKSAYSGAYIEPRRSRESLRDIRISLEQFFSEEDNKKLLNRSWFEVKERVTEEILKRLHFTNLLTLPQSQIEEILFHEFHNVKRRLL